MTRPRINAHSLLIVAAAILLPIVGGCNPNGYADLWKSNDIAIPCEGTTTTWIRQYYEDGMPISTPEEEELALRTEFMIVRAEVDPVTGEPSFTETGCMDLSRIHRNGTLDLLEGSFLADGLGGGIWEIPQMHEFIHETGVRILDRKGSETFTLDPHEIHDVTMAMNGGELTLTIDGVDRHYQNLMTVLASISTTTQEGATLMGQVLNVGLLVSQVRVRGFGGAGMTEYIQTPKSFRGLVEGEIHVAGNISAGRVDMTVDYIEFADFTGMVMDGPQIVDVSWGGDGTMGGASDFVIQLDPIDPTNVLTGTFDYEGVTIMDGFGSGGSGTLTLNGTPFTVITDEVLITDLRAIPILPLD